MKASRLDWDGSDPGGLAAELRALQPPLSEVSDAVAEIIAAVEVGGDEAVLRCEREFGTEPASLRVPERDLADPGEGIERELLSAIETAAANVETFARSGEGGEGGEETTLLLDPGRESAGTGARLSSRRVPLASAGAYVPGAGGAYPSTAVMCCVPARVAGVERVAVASPPGPDGRVNALVLAAARISGATEAYAMGGAQAIAALALGTESVEPVDLVVGPGNRYVTEAKRQLVGRVGIDGVAGPSELMVIADGAVEPRLLALDLCAQAEHGPDGLLVACVPAGAQESEDLLARIEAETVALAATRPSVKEAPLALVSAPTPQAAIELANALAPEHLELACERAEALSEGVLYAGCVLVGREGATAFGDYAAGSNHVLPTGAAGRFQGPLGPDSFRRSITRVKITAEGARGLAPVVATLAEAEGFPVHGESATARADRPEGGAAGHSEDER